MFVICLQTFVWLLNSYNVIAEPLPTAYFRGVGS